MADALPELQINEFRITVESRFGTLVPQVISASSIQDLLHKALKVPLLDWLPPEDDDV